MPTGDAAAPGGQLEPWQEPVRGGPADPLALTLSGRELLLALRDGRLREPANARLTGRRLVEVGEREVTFALPLSPWLQGPKGRIHPGVLVLLGDSALTGAALTALPRGVVFSTAELSMSFLGELPPPGGELTARATVLHSELRHSLAVVDILGPGGERLGFGSSRVFLQPPVELDGAPPLPPPALEPDWGTPDPWARALGPAPDAVSPAQTVGLDVLQETASGSRPRPPIDRLMGIFLEAAGAGETHFRMAASEWLTNELGTVSGGALGLLAHSATSAAGQALARPGAPYRALDIKVNFLQPVPADGEPISAVGRAQHRGKLVVATTEVTHRGDLVVLATGSTVLGA